MSGYHFPRMRCDSCGRTIQSGEKVKISVVGDATKNPKTLYVKADSVRAHHLSCLR